MDDNDELQRRNHHALMLMQAMLGSVTQAILAVSIDVTHEDVTIYFAVREMTSELQEDIEDIVTDFEAFSPDVRSITVETFEGAPSEDWPGRNADAVFKAKL